VSDTLLATKTHIPPLRSNLVTRPHLIQRLNDGITQNHRLILISAPAGYGKSTLLVEWVSQLNNTIAWLSLDMGENNPVRFWNYFITALSTIPYLEQSGIGDLIPQYLRSRRTPSIEMFLEHLVNELFWLKDRVWLVLDDLHVITESQIHQDLIFLIDHLPQSAGGLHLAIASRMDPPWPLARWRVRDELTEVRTKDLRFSPDEAATFLNSMMEVKLSSQDIARLDHRTEGWIAGLQMTALSMQSKEDVVGFLEDFTGTHRFVLDYLLEEVLSLQKPEVLNFLLRTSLLEYLTAPLCDAITDCQGSQTTLIQLEKSNMFLVSMDDERRWYRYHHLFADLLQSRLKQTQPEIIPAIHDKACTWYTENGYLSNALTHAIAANDLIRLVKLVEKYAFTTLDINQASTFLSWLNSLPDAVMRSSPWLYIAHAWLSAYLGQQEEIEPSILEAEKYADQSNRRLLGYIAAMWTLMGELRSDRVDGLLYASRAFELLPTKELQARAFVAYHKSNILAWSGDIVSALKNLELTSTWSLSAGDTEMAMTAKFEKASILYVLGRLAESLQAFKKTFQMVASDHPDKKKWSLPVGFAYLKLSALYLEWDNTSEAMRLASKGIQICRRWGYQDYLYNGLLKLADVLLAIGDKDSALSTIQEAKEVFSDNPITSRVRGQEAVINLARGDIKSALAWVAQSGLSPGDTIDYFHRFLYLHFATILQAQGKLQEAYSVLERLGNILERAGAITMLLETLSQRIIILSKLNEDKEVLSILQRAIELAKPEGFIRVFTSKGPPMLSLLQSAFSQGIETEYIKRLIKAFNITNISNESGRHPTFKNVPELMHAGLIESLSERELQVLRLLDGSLTSQEIGRELYLSTNTVRTHIRNIYSKLAVHGRIEAIQKAKEYALI
jgi:LuxR family maltose regulon positive regulatory protein